MRWHDVPWLDGQTDPLGTISSPYGSLGISGPLRLAVGQPPLVGEELGVPGTPILPAQQLQPLVRMAPSPDWAPPSLSLSATTTAVRSPIPTERPPPEWPRPPRPQPNGRVPFKEGKPFFRGYGELAPSAPQMDANFSTSPVQMATQAAGAQNVAAWQGYGGNLIASNHYGDLGVAEILVERRSSAPAAISAVLSTLRNIGRNAGLDTAAAISVREGVPVSGAALEVISTRGMGEDDLQRRIAQLEAKAAVAKSRRQRRKYKELRVRILALRARLRDVRKGNVQGVKDMKEVAGDKSRIPPWVTYAGLALGAASVVIAVLATRGQRKAK